MYKFSKTSLDRLNSCDSRIIKLCDEIIKHVDIVIVCGHRNQEDQDKAFKNGFSKVKFPNSKHNSYPSLAVDICPYVNNALSYDIKELIHLAKFIKSVAANLDIPIKYGGDWPHFKDYPHWNL